MNRSLKVPAGLLLLFSGLLSACASAPSAAEATRAVPFTASSSLQLQLLPAQQRIGEWLALRYRSPRPAYFNLFALHSSGRSTQLLSNAYSQRSDWQQFPATTGKSEFQLTGPAGTERFILLATSQPLSLFRSHEYRSSPATGAVHLHLTASELRHRLQQFEDEAAPGSFWQRSEATLRIIP